MRSLVIVLALALTGTALNAQDPTRLNTRQGVWFGLGLGGGSAGADCNLCGNDRTTGLTGYGRIGGTVSPSILLGAEAAGWFHSENGVDESIGFLTAILMWYPSRRGAAHLNIGVGVMGYSADDGTNKVTANAPGGTVGFGYDFRVGRNFSLTPFFNVYGSSSVSARLNGVALPLGDKIKVNLLQLGLGFTWH